MAWVSSDGLGKSNGPNKSNGLAESNNLHSMVYCLMAHMFDAKLKMTGVGTAGRC
jgi:hypothetical protein